LGLLTLGRLDPAALEDQETKYRNEKKFLAPNVNSLICVGVAMDEHCPERKSANALPKWRGGFSMKLSRIRHGSKWITCIRLEYE
jgi:hypothetical protein